MTTTETEIEINTETETKNKTKTDSTGCPFSAKHNQTPDLQTDDPLVAANAGNYNRAFELLAAREEDGTATATDFELMAFSLVSCGQNAEAANYYGRALEAEPTHQRAGNWETHIKECERTARNGASILRENPITRELLEADPADLYQDHPDNWVLCSEDQWQKPGDYVAPLSLRDHLANRFHAFMTDILTPVGIIIDKIVPQKPDSAGRWTELPAIGNGILRLAELSHGRTWMAKRARNEDLKRGNLPGNAPPGRRKPGYAQAGWTPEGADNNDSWGYEGRVGAPIPVHGLDADYQAVDRSQNPNLPDPALLAKDFGYRNGNIIEATTVSAHAWGHLQVLVHDVMQTAPDNQAKHGTPVAPDSEEAAMGIEKVYYRSDAPNVLYGADGPPMNGVSGGWDMSPIYGSSIEELAEIRTNPNTGKPCPNGKIYLDGMDENGKGGEFLPVKTLPNGEQQIVTGFGRNMTMPLEAEHTLYARHHNWVCDILAERYPHWSDNQVHAIARRTVTMTYLKIHTAPWTDALFAHPSVVQGLHANVYGRREWKKPVDEQRMFDPKGGTHPIADGLVSGAQEDYGMPEVKGQGFAEAYRMGHQLVPDLHYFPAIGEKTDKTTTEAIDLKDLRELDGHRFLKERGLGFAFHGLMNTRLGAPVANNTADFFRRMDSEEGRLDMVEAEIIKDRQRGMPAYNDYRRAHNLPGIRTWDDLFKEPSSPESQEKIAKLAAHYPGGVEDLDPSIGLMLNEHRPTGFAITNEGFQTFVFEATSRIQKQELLTRKWRPEEVSWTAINLVEKINKEKLLYLHCPELRDYLKTRENRNTFEYMGTNATDAPEEHPLADILNYGDEDLEDVGLGDPWTKEHIMAGGIDHYMIRVNHIPSNTVYIVDLAEENVYFDADGDGRIQAGEILQEDPPDLTREELIAAAQDIRAGADIPWPGVQSKKFPDFGSGWRLTQAEVARLTSRDGDKDGKGVPARLTDLQIHILIFNLADDIENAGFSENKMGWDALEQSKFRAFVQTVGSTITFGGLNALLTWKIPLDNDFMGTKRPEKSTKIFGQDGMIDQGKMDEYVADLSVLAEQYPNGAIPKDAFLKQLEDKDAIGSLTSKQWGSLFRLLKRLNNSETITVETFKQLYNGELLIRMYEFFAPEELKEKLKDKLPENVDKACPLGHTQT